MGFLKDIYTKQRFSPNVLSVVINPFYFTRKRLFKGVRGLAPTLSGRLLDFGCGSKPYKRLFVNATEYIGVDIENEGHDHRTEEVDVYYDGKVLPFDFRRFTAHVSCFPRYCPMFAAYFQHEEIGAVGAAFGGVGQRKAYLADFFDVHGERDFAFRKDNANGKPAQRFFSYICEYK